MPLHDAVGINCKTDSTTENQGADVNIWAKGVLSVLCVCVICLDMTTPPWWREKVMVYYYYYLFINTMCTITNKNSLIVISIVRGSSCKSKYEGVPRFFCLFYKLIVKIKIHRHTTIILI